MTFCSSCSFIELCVCSNNNNNNSSLLVWVLLTWGLGRSSHPDVSSLILGGIITHKEVDFNRPTKNLGKHLGVENLLL